MTDFDIEINNIWAKDKLNRKGYADFLYKIIESAQTSEEEDNALIFAIDGEWGTGKSFFIDLWIKDLKAKGHLVSRFDAWKNDIVDEPLVGFLSHIYADLGEWDKRRAVKVVDEKIKQSQKLLLPLVKELLKGAAIKGLGTLVTDEAAKEVVKAIVEGHDKVTEDDVKDEQSMSSMLIHRQLQAHNKNLQLIEDFKNKLSETAKKVTENRDKKFPVFIFIDELDRCRPDYAVRLLEVVKHIFNSKGICFISSVNITQLQESIKTIYGEKFESNIYLDRFFNHRLKLPTPSIKHYISSLNEFNSIKDAKVRLLASDANKINQAYETYLDFYATLSFSFNFDLRTIKSIFSRLTLCRTLLIGSDGEFFHDELLFLILCMMKKGSVQSNSSFEVVLNSVPSVINTNKYLYLRNGNENYSPIFTGWSSLIRVLREIYSKNESMRNNDLIEDSEYDLYVHILRELGGSHGSFTTPVKRLLKYMEVCGMSGRLDE
nr:P-loop NTPase fold protein [uncultured Comamonas sp.]